MSIATEAMEERHDAHVAKIMTLHAADIAQLQARVRELEAADLAAGELLAQVHAAHTADRARLAAATAALDRCHGMLPHYARKALRDALAGQPAAPWRCQKCTGDHAASETCQPAVPPVAITQPAWSLPLRDDQPAAPYYKQPRGKGGQIFAMSEPFEYEPAAPTRPPGDHGDRHNPDIAGYDPNCEHCVYTAPTRTEAYDAALSAEGMPDPELKQRYMLGRTEACDACPDVATCCVSGCTLKLRTKAERAVLDAMGELPEMWLEAWSVCRLSNVETLARAELARRGLR